MIWKIIIGNWKEDLFNTLQNDYDSEAEDLINPKDELKKKIVNLAGTIKKWNEETVKVRKSVREQLKAITDWGLNEYKMQKKDLRNLINKIFLFHGIHPSWVRKLLPVELKDTSKTRLSYLQKQEIKKERHRLLQLHPKLQQRSEIKEYSLTDGSTVVANEIQSLPSQLNSRHQLVSQEYTSSDGSAKISETSKPRISMSEDISKIELKIAQGKLDNAIKEIDRLQIRVRQLSEQFIAKTYLQAGDQDIPLVAQIDPVKKIITSIQIDESH
jgi:hypothetical protein